MEFGLEVLLIVPVIIVFFIFWMRNVEGIGKLFVLFFMILFLFIFCFIYPSPLGLKKDFPYVYFSGGKSSFMVREKMKKKIDKVWEFLDIEVVDE